MFVQFSMLHWILKLVKPIVSLFPVLFVSLFPVLFVSICKCIPEYLSISEEMLGLQGVGRIVDASQVSLEDDFFNFHERKTLAELKDPAIDADKCYIVEATIKYLLDPQGWWYNMCSCNKPVQPDSVSYYCGPCDHRVVNVQTRYRIRIKVIDETDSTIFVIFDRPALILLKRSCSDLIASCEKTAAGVTCPVEIMNLLDRRLLFKVEIKKDFDGRFKPSYTVKRATDHVEILAKFRVAAPPKDNDTSVQSASLSKCSMSSKNLSMVQPLDLSSQFSEIECESSKDNRKDVVPVNGETGIENHAEVLQSTLANNVICIDSDATGAALLTPNKRFSEEFENEWSGGSSTTTVKLIKKIKQEKDS
ncbi:hypothetical protein OROMI_029356 [Orobanche minor]